MLFCFFVIWLFVIVYIMDIIIIYKVMGIPS